MQQTLKTWAECGWFFTRFTAFSSICNDIYQWEIKFWMHAATCQHTEKAKEMQMKYIQYHLTFVCKNSSNMQKCWRGSFFTRTAAKHTKSESVDRKQEYYNYSDKKLTYLKLCKDAVVKEKDVWILEFKWNMNICVAFFLV